MNAPFDYQSFYCEENVWRLAAHERFVSANRFAVFVSNEQRAVPLWCQRASPTSTDPVVWDYHVFLVVDDTVWDLDTTLAHPTPVAAYARATFRVDTPPWAPLFRVIDADVFRDTLATDRSHMRDEAGAYRAPPPAWPTIGEGTNLMRFVDMADEGIPGEVLDLAGFVARFES